eukprot:COSAG02_NODE_4903_length_4849_cov_4.669263_2_plen_86_part_00
MYCRLTVCWYRVNPNTRFRVLCTHFSAAPALCQTYQAPTLRSSGLEKSGVGARAWWRDALPRIVIPVYQVVKCDFLKIHHYAPTP